MCVYLVWCDVGVGCGMWFLGLGGGGGVDLGNGGIPR